MSGFGGVSEDENTVRNVANKGYADGASDGDMNITGN